MFHRAHCHAATRPAIGGPILAGLALAGLTAAWLAAAWPAAAQVMPRCPVFASAADAGLCQVEAPPPAETAPGMAPLIHDPDLGLRLLNDRPILAGNEISLLRRGRETAPETDYDDRLAIGMRQSDAAALQPRAYDAAYELPFLDGLALSNTSGVSQQEGEAGPDNPAQAFDSRFGFTYRERGVTLRVNPNAAANWGDLAGSGSRRIGVDNTVSAMIARDLTLTLSSGYDSLSHPGNPLADTTTGRNRIGIAQHFASGYRFGLSAQQRTELLAAEERNYHIFGLQVGLPLDDSLTFTASHDIGLGEKRGFGTTGALPFTGRQQNLDLQLHWTPALLASRAMTLMAGYGLSRDDLAGDADPYLTRARLNLAMRF